MNNIRYYLCKNTLAAGLALIVVGCSDPVLDAGNSGKDAPTVVTREFNAFIDNEPETRTGMGELNDGKYPVVWSEGDKVLLAYGYNTEEATLFKGAGTNKAIFRGRYWDNTQHITSVYPAEGASSRIKFNTVKTGPNGSRYFLRELTLTAVLPHNQLYQTGTFANNVLPMIGLCTNQYDFYYENIGAVLQLPVKGDGTISKIVLTGNDDELLAGEFTVNYNYYLWNPDESGNRNVVTVDHLEDKVVESDREAACGRLITPVAGKSTGMITIDCGEDGLKLDPQNPTMINIVMLPKTFKKGFSVQFIDLENGGAFVKTTSAPITVKRSYVKTMEVFDYKKPEPLEPANCYVVDKDGYYLMPAFCMGNRPKSARLDVDEKGTFGKTGNSVEADYLWTDVPGAISDIEYIPGKDGYISFKVNADENGNTPKGNTVVALYDAVTKEILWSWHIWMSECNEVTTNGSCRAGESTADGFTSDAAKGKLIIMDRNLGAISADKNDGWKTYGLYYQMGKKDPYVGGNIAGGDELSLGVYLDKNHQDQNMPQYNNFEETPFGERTNHTEWNTSLTQGWNYIKEFITGIYGYQHPMDFASSWEKKNDTRWTETELNQTDPFVSNGKHEDFWNRSKTIKDPCPAGWTIMGENGDLYGKPSKTISYMSGGIYGIEAEYAFNGESPSIVWWPASGFRSVDGMLGNLGLGGYYWWFDHIDADHGGHGWWFAKDSKKEVYKNASGVMTNHACSVRCVKAKQP